jgi:signal transduction histidine kinase
MTGVRDSVRGGRLWPPWLVPPAARHLAWISFLAVAVFQEVGSNLAAQNQADRVPLDAFARVLLLVGPVLLLVRYRYPRIAVFGVSAAALLYFGAGYPYGPIFASVAVACFAAIIAGHRRAAWSAVGALWAGHLVAAHWLYRWLPPAGDGPAPWSQELGVAAWVAAIVAASELARVRREQLARERAEREEAQRRRADEERLRIARELHDVLAHSIAVINVQAGVGLALLDKAPDQARTALTTIKAASKDALGEVRQVLDTLRPPASRPCPSDQALGPAASDFGAAPRSPAPGLERLPELTEQASGVGLSVGVTVDGEQAVLPAGADLAAFRIVQEALTNIVRHSAARTAQVVLRYASGQLEIRVDDDGPATEGGDSGGGRGLLGMRERAAALGGTVTAGPRADGGFRVLARIPVASPTTAAQAPTRAPGPAPERESP